MVPARDEGAVLAERLAAAVAQAAPGDEVVVVDDHSTDDTAAVAAAAGATVVLAPPLPPGWTGKAWACATGAATTTGAVLCFLDADTTLAPGALDRLVGAQADAGGLVSAQPYHRVPRPYERLSAFFNVVALMGTEGCTPLGDRRRPGGAFGPVLVVSRRDYDDLGGHASVAGAVLDDVELARVWHAGGRRVHLYGGAGVATFRMYPGGLGHLLEGWTKNFGAGARAVRPVAAVLVALWLSLPLEALWWALRLATHGGRAGGVAAAAGLYGVVVVQLWWMLRRVGSFGFVTALAFPVPLVVFGATFLVSLALSVTRRPVRWKGRRVPSGPRSAQSRPGP